MSYNCLWLYSLCGPRPTFSFLIYTQSVELLGCGISPLQGRYLHTEQVSRQLPTAEAQVRAQIRSCGICNRQSGIGGRFSPST
jgi:hypothetical protein